MTLAGTSSSLRTRLLGCLLVVVLAAPMLSGCRQGGLRARVVNAYIREFEPIDGPTVTFTRFTGIDVENFKGSVRVLVDERYEEGSVAYRVRWKKAYHPDEWASFKEHAWVKAEHVVEGERSVLRVLSTSVPGASVMPEIDVTIRVPVCDGVVVRNSGGNVEIVGAGGAIKVENDGYIEYRTARPIEDPITLVTSKGHINLVASPDSEGTFTIETDDGRVGFSSEFGVLKEVRPTRHSWSGIWNDGQNQIVLRTGDGNARVRVVERPNLYSTGFRF